MGRFDYEKKAVNFKHSGKGQKVNKKYKANVCQHGNTPGNCSDCTKERNAATAKYTRTVHRAKRVKKAKKKQKGGWCSFVVLAVFGALGSLGWGIVELANWIIG